MLVTNGGKHAVYNTFQTLLDPGDEVLLPAPYWTTYPGGDRARRRRARRACPPPRATGFRVTVEQLEAARTPRTKVLLFVSPSNPTGAVYPPDEVEAIGRWAVEHGIWVVTDEIYEHLTYGDHEFTSMPVVVPELADTCVVLNGVAKTYAMTGLARRLDDRSARRHHGRDQPAVAPDVERRQRRASAPRSPRSAATSTRSPRCAPPSSGAGG